MIFNDVFSNVFGNVPAGDEDNIVKVAVGAVRAGWAVVVDKPGSKAPMCILTARQAKQADKLARQGAEAAGDPSYARRRHACGLHHALTDDAQARRVVTRLVKDNGPVNLGLELGRSRLVVVDVDTAQEHSAFIRMWEDATGTDTGLDSPTVLSPGARDKDGQWVHKDGGHYWFTLPDGIELPQGMGVLKGEGGWSVMWRDKQVLVPPSSRPEGTYRLVGQPRPLPEWLHAFIVEQASQRLTQRSESVKRALGSDSSIDRWAATAAWGDLLEPDGWTDTGLIDNCGCPVWTAPGTHASPKSATAHDHGCDRYDTIGGHAPLHVWTDNPPEWVADALSAKGTNTITKLTYLAYRFHGGDNKVAVRELGIGADEDDPFFGSSGSTTDAPSSPKSSPAADPMDDEEDLSDDDDDGEDQDPDEDDGPDVYEVHDESHFLALPDVEEIVSGLIAAGTLVRFYGRSNHGKSFVVQDLMLHMALGRPWAGRDTRRAKVMYLPYEGRQGFKKRLQAWMGHHRVTTFDGHFLSPGVMPQINDAMAWAKLIRTVAHHGVEVVILDTQSMATAGLDENTAEAMSRVLNRLIAMIQRAGAAVWLVHHMGHAAEHARGSTVMLAGMDTEIKVVREEDGTHTVTATKQRDLDTEDGAEMRFERVKTGPSAVLEYLDPGSDDPFDSPAAADERPMWQRMAQIVGEAAPTLGLTRTDAIGLTRDRYAVPRKSRSQLYRAWDRIVDGGWVDEIVNMDTSKGTGRFVLAREVDPGQEDQGTNQDTEVVSEVVSEPS